VLGRRLSFNYLDTCASIALRSEDAVMSARKSGEQGQDLLPVVSVGHSGGALLHVLSDCLFRPAADRSGNGHKTPILSFASYARCGSITAGVWLRVWGLGIRICARCGSITAGVWLRV